MLREWSATCFLLSTLFPDFIWGGRCGPVCVFILRAARRTSKALYLLCLPVRSRPPTPTADTAACAAPCLCGAVGLPASPGLSSRPGPPCSRGNGPRSFCPTCGLSHPRTRARTRTRLRWAGWAIGLCSGSSAPRTDLRGKPLGGRQQPREWLSRDSSRCCPTHSRPGDSLSLLSSWKGSFMYLKFYPSLMFFLSLFSFFPSLSLEFLLLRLCTWIHPGLSLCISYCFCHCPLFLRVL